jgi:hypothetical protein
VIVFAMESSFFTFISVMLVSSLLFRDDDLAGLRS